MFRARRTVRRSRVTGQVIGLVTVLALFAAACGDDDDDSGGAPASTSSATQAGASTTTAGATDATAAATTTTSDAGPVSGGEATILMNVEVGTLDPVKATGSAGSDASRMFPLYGALVTYESGEAKPYFAESLTPSADFATWTLKLRPGIVFSDGSPYDAAAVKANWDRAADPANSSPARGFVAGFESTTVTDPLTLEIKLKAPNAHVPANLSRFGALNYVASGQALAAKQDLTSTPVGAGPYTMQEWVRDDHMTLVKNPNFVDSPRPYLDKITLRWVGDEQQRLDTFLKGDADAGYTNLPGTAAAAAKEGNEYVSVTVGTGQTYVFNTTTPPFNDPRVRRAFVLGIDREAMGDVVFGEGNVPATSFSRPGSKWFDEQAAIPGYDPAEAQRLFSEAAADLGGSVDINLQGFQLSLEVRKVEYIQTALNAFDNVNVEVNIFDSSTAIQNVLRGDYQVSSWGFPWLDPEPGVYNALRSGLPTNYSKYADPAVDAALDQARVTDDDTARLELYKVA